MKALIIGNKCAKFLGVNQATISHILTNKIKKPKWKIRKKIKQ